MHAGLDMISEGGLYSWMELDWIVPSDTMYSRMLDRRTAFPSAKRE